MYAYFIYVFIYFKYKILTIKIFKIISYNNNNNNWSSTHILAQYAKNVVSYVTWIEETPSIIELALAQDVLFLSSS